MSTKRDRHGILCSIVPDLLDNIGGIGTSLSRDLRKGYHKRIPNITINPEGYSDWKVFMRDYFCASLLKKYPALDLGIDRVSVAVGKFLKSEEVCRTVNGKFRNPLTSFSYEHYGLLVRARDLIAKVLGNFSWDSAIQYCDFGPGANVGIPRRSSHLCKKIGNKNPTVTGECRTLLEAYMRFDPHVGDIVTDVCQVPGSIATTVPKDARSDRFIAIEPQWNMFFQKGIGGMIRRRLRLKGVDLDDGQPVNQELARQGSETGCLATIDLSSASDTISHDLVEFLLPDDWYIAMSTVRSTVCDIPNGDRVFLQKFSSMGNGYTFELESLIFYALVKAVFPNGRPGRDVAVFGDDIILPSTEAGRLIELLGSIGFSTNKEKSFISGPFRESCGKHYFRGRDVTPFYLKKEIASYHDILWLINSIRRFAHRYLGIGYGCDGCLFPTWLSLTKRLPRRFQSLSCPEGFGDDAVVRDFDECSPRPRPNKGQVEGYSSSFLALRRNPLEYDGMPGLITKLWYSRREAGLGEHSQYSRTDYTPIYRLAVSKREYPRWSTLGPWVRE